MGGRGLVSVAGGVGMSGATRRCSSGGEVFGDCAEAPATAAASASLSASADTATVSV